MVTLTIATPADFRFHATVTSHGWYQLAPNRYNEQTETLTRKLRLPDGTVLDLTLRGTKANAIHVQVNSTRVLTSLQRNALSRAINNMFNLGVDLRDFYKVVRETAGYGWVDEYKIGRAMASPTIWEDVAKTLTTTNISWSGTKEMARKLTLLDPDDAFPTPQQIVALSKDDLAAQTGMGYRAPYLHDLAQKIVDGEVDIENWRSLSSEDLYKTVIGIKGFGEYAAGTVLRLLGHFDKLAIDSVARTAYENIVGEKPENDAAIRQRYESFGEWRGLVLWMDCIRDAYETETPVS